MDRNENETRPLPGLFYTKGTKIYKKEVFFMKKILSLGLVGVMALSMIPTALATTDYSNGTRVEYTANDEANTAYTITVPALLTPGAEGTVKLEGTWASDATVKVTADQTVTLTNSINSADQKVLDVTFAGIEKVGDNTAIVTATEAVSVADIDNALFGTWSGKFNYNVELVELITFTIEGTSYQAEDGMTWREWVNSDYSPVGFSIDTESNIVEGPDGEIKNPGIFTSVLPDEKIKAKTYYRC